jgi:hypothetical protein
VVVLDGNRTVSANFTTNTYTLTVTRAGTGSGTVTTNPAGIACGTTCAASFESGTLVTLHAEPDFNSTFTGWSGACSGTGDCTIEMSATKNVTATFVRKTHTLTVIKAGNGSGTVTSSPAGVNCGTACTFTFDAGTAVSLSAVADSTSNFAGWSGACSGTGGCMITMDSNKAVTATFTSKTYALTVNRTGPGVVASSPSGIYCGAACSTVYDAGTLVTLTAAPDPGAGFAGWTGACSGTGPCIVTVNSALTVNAVFNPPTATPTGTPTPTPTLTPTLSPTHTFTATPTSTWVTLAVNRSGAGLVYSEPGGLYCGADCVHSFPPGTAVTLTAFPDAGASFTGWSGGVCAGTGTCVIVLNANTLVAATFINPLVIQKTGTGTGSVVSVPSGINCGSTCAAQFATGTLVSLSASASVGSSFAGWSGACTGTGTCVLTMDQAKNVTAEFTRQYFTLTVARTGTGGGTVSSSPAGISCGATCEYVFDAGTVVGLSAVADAHSTFTGWSGACAGTGGCFVTMDSIKSVAAEFTKRTYTLTVTRSGAGTVASEPGGIYCGVDCNSTYDSGTAVTLTAIPDGGGTFSGWTGACTGTGPCVVTMDAAKNVGATFNP